ncbi:hypothetical protein [Paenibacillus sp. WLX2291]|uniref:hypothetical protein n=1 Tax=Paenibacillus sp. WLX2291 TaxID=3296934 RepID=UPI0039846058
MIFKKLLLLVVTLLLLIVTLLPASSEAASPVLPDFHDVMNWSQDTEDNLSFPRDFYIQTDIVNLSDERTLFVNQEEGTLYMTSLSSSTRLWSHTYDHLYSYDVLDASGKIVIIVSQNHKLQKIVLSLNGNTLSTFIYPTALLQTLNTGGNDQTSHLSWSAQTAGNAERIALQTGQQVLIYRSPWNKPVRTLSLQAYSNNNNEALTVLNMEYESNKLVIRYRSGELHDQRYVFELLDTSSASHRSHLVRAPLSTIGEFKLDQGQAVIYLSNDTGNKLQKDGSTSYPIYSRYDVTTGKLLVQRTRVFTDAQQNWRTDYNNHQVFVQVDSEQRLYLWDQAGNELWRTPTLSDQLLFRFIKYEKGTLYLLVEDQNRQFRIVKQPLV